MNPAIQIAVAAVLSGLAQPTSFVQVTGGLRDHQVIQRTSRDSALVTLAGESDDGGTVEIRVGRTGSGETVLDWRKLAVTRSGKWSGELRDLPVGGPYRIELRIGPALSRIDDVLVGDLWLLAGQSNMQGDGLLANAAIGNEFIHSFDPSGQWMLAKEPLHVPSGAAGRGAGLGLPFAVEMVRQTRVPIGLIPCARSGTSMEQWSPDARDSADSLYGAMYRRVEAVGGRVAGVLWYQGEADGKPGMAEQYRDRLEQWIAAVRRDFHAPELPFHYVQIGRNVSDANVHEWSAVRDAQRQVELRVPQTAMTTSVDLPLEDAIHVATDGLKTLGRRLALIASGAATPGPRPAVAMAGDGFIRLKLSGVNGRILDADRLSGFTVANADGRMRSRVFSVRVDPEDSTSLLLYFDDGKIPPRFLWYGYGKDPYCNVRDAAGMALPAFGPIPVNTGEARPD